MKKSIIAAMALLCASLSYGTIPNLAFQQWYYAQTYMSLLLYGGTNLVLASDSSYYSIDALEGGTLAVDMTASRVLNVTKSPTPEAINGILPWVTTEYAESGYSNRNWGVYTGGAIRRYTNYVTSTSIGSWSTNSNVRPSGTIANTGSNTVTVNSLVLDHATPFAQNRTQFTLNSGALMINASIPYVAPVSGLGTRFNFDGKRGYIWMKNGTVSYISIAANLTTFDGTNGVVVNCGSGTNFTQFLYDCFGASGGLSTFYANQSGDFWLNCGDFGFAGSNPNLLGTGDSTYYLQGGTLIVGSDGTIDYDRPLVFRGCNATNSHVTLYTYFGTGGPHIKKFRSLSPQCGRAEFSGFGVVAGAGANICQIKNAMTLTTNTTIISKFDASYVGNITYFDLQFMSGIIGAYDLTLGGGQRISLYGTNTYSGLTTLTNTVAAYLYNNSNLLGTVGLNFANYGTSSMLNIGTGLNVPVNKLYFRGTEQLSTTFGSSSSAAFIKDDTRFAGTGILTVTNGPTGPTQWDIVLGIGQSNMNGLGNLTNSPVTVYGAAYQTTNSGSSFAQLEDPTGVIYGSCVPAFANKWFTETGRGVIYIYGGGYAGSSLLPAAEPTAGYNWTKGDGYLYTNAVTQMNGAIAAVGGAVANKIVLWIQGEQDASLINGSTITGPLYEDALVTLITNLNADVTGGIDSFRVSELGAFTNGTLIAECAEIRTAQSNAVAAVAYASMPFTGAKDFVAEGKMADVVHYDQTGLNEVGEGLASEGL